MLEIINLEDGFPEPTEVPQVPEWAARRRKEVVAAARKEQEETLTLVDYSGQRHQRPINNKAKDRTCRSALVPRTRGSGPWVERHGAGARRNDTAVVRCSSTLSRPLLVLHSSHPITFPPRTPACACPHPVTSLLYPHQAPREKEHARIG